MMVLVTYDVNTETPAGKRRLRRVAKACENFGQRVQNSVFECLLDPAEWVALRSRLVKATDQELDSLPFLISRQELAATGGTHWSQADLQPGRAAVGMMEPCAKPKLWVYPGEVRGGCKQ